MKRSPLKRSTKPLKTYSRLTSKTRIRRVSPKRQAALTGANGYIAFSKALRAERPNCELRTSICTGKTQGVHHVIKRSQGGALIPGLLADRQGQNFMAACNPCNGWVEDNPMQARVQGFVKTNPARMMK